MRGARHTRSLAGYDRVPIAISHNLEEEQPDSRSSISRLRSFKAPREIYATREEHTYARAGNNGGGFYDGHFS